MSIQTKIEETAKKIRKNHNSWGFKIHKDLVGQASIGVYNEDVKIITTLLDEVVKMIKNHPTRWDGYEHKNIEVYKDEIISILKSKEKI